MPLLLVGSESGNPIDLYYEDFGAGDPVVFVHGWPLTHRSWEPQIRPFVEAGYRVITYDRRGFGQSTQTWAGYDHDSFAADLHTLIEDLDLTAITLVGASSGGGDVARYVGRYGTSRVVRIVFASAVLPALRTTLDNPDGGLDDGAIRDLISASSDHRVALLDQVLTSFFSVDGELAIDQPTRSYNLQLATAGSPKGTTDSIAAWATTDFRADLDKIDVRTLVVHGDADAFVPFEISGERTGATIVGSQTILIPNGPHAVAITHADQWNDAVLSFLTQSG